jgi:hypothetical protein
MKTVEERREEVLEELRAMDGARRGQISEQYYTRKTAEGRKVRQGPYYVWQRWVKGKKVSARIKPQDVKRVKADLERGHAVEEIFEAYFTLLEEAAVTNDQASKKNPSRSSRPRAGRPKRSSS